jgi:glycosyltransferase involved in cell wall biosynthesis
LSKKILFVIDTLQTGGAEKSLLEIASRFKRYIPVMVHVYPGEELKKQFIKAGIRVISLNQPGKYNFKKASKKLDGAIREEQPSLIHSSLFRSDMICRGASAAKGIPLVNSLVNDSYSPYRYASLSLAGKLKLFTVQLWDRFSSKEVTHFVSNSEAVKRSNAKKLNIPLNKITVIYRGRERSIFDKVTTQQIDQLRQELNLGEKKIILNVGRLLERKGQLDLIRAFGRIQLDFPDTHLLISGAGSFQTRLQEEIQALHLQYSVSLLGSRSDIPVLLKMADVFAFPSYFEGLPGALIEAMLSETTIVATAIPENLECVNNDSAFLFSPGNIEEIARQLTAALTEKSLGQQKAQRALQDAVQRFDITQIAHEYELLYDRILDRQ